MGALLLILGIVWAAGTQPVWADGTVWTSFDVANGQLTISGTATPGETGVVRVFRPGKAPDALADVTPETLLDVLQYAGELTVGADGTYALSYVAQGMEGWHDILIRFPSGTQQGRYYFVTQQGAESAVDALNQQGTSGDAVRDMVENNGALQVNGPIKAALDALDPAQTYLTEVYAALAAGRPYADLAAYQAAFQGELAVQHIKRAADADAAMALLTQYVDVLGLGSLPAYGKTYCETLTDAGREQVAKDLLTGSYADLSAFCTTFCDSTIVTALSHAKNWMDVRPILTDNRTYLTGFAFASYDTLEDEEEKPAVDAAVAGETITSVSQLRDVFNRAVEDVLSQRGQGGTGNMGGNGGGGSGGNRGSGGGNTGSFGVNTPAVASPSPAAQAQFADLDTVPWAVESIERLSAFGFVNGKEPGKFCPDDPITREEFVKILVLSFGLHDESAVCSFIDVPQDAWYTSYVASAAQTGIAQGRTDGAFGIGERVTREDMAVLAYRALGDRAQEAMVAVDGLVFTDDDEISDYAREAVYWMKDAGIIQGVGDNRFDARGNATRAEAAKILYGLLSWATEAA